MPLGIKPICTVCKTSNSTLWRKGIQGEILCNSCGLKQQNGSSKDTKGNNGNSSKTNGNANGGVQILRKSLRLKPSKHKASAFLKTIPTKGKSRRIIFKKSRDIFRGYVVMANPIRPVKIGPEEELPRKMEFMEFVCHAPSDYYESPITPYTTIPMKPELCFIWKPLQDPIRPAPCIDELYGVKDTTIKIEKPEKKEREKSEKKEKEKVPKKEVEKKIEKPVETLQPTKMPSTLNVVNV